MKINCTDKETEVLFNMMDEAVKTMNAIQVFFGNEDPSIAEAGEKFKKHVYNGEVDEKVFCAHAEVMTVIYKTIGKVAARVIPIILEEGALANEELEKVTEKYK